MKYHTERGVIVTSVEDDRRSRSRSISPALSTCSSHTIGRTPSPPRVATSKRPREPHLDHHHQDVQEGRFKRARHISLDPPADRPDTIYIDSDDDMDENEIIEHGLDLAKYRRERSARVEGRGRRRGPRMPILPRNPQILPPAAEIDSYSWKNVVLRVGKTIELRDGTFLHLKAIIQDLQSGITTLRGWQLKRCMHLDGLLPKRLNELCYVYEVDMNDPRPIAEQSVVQVLPDDIVKVRHLIKTNEPFPRHRFSEDVLPGLPKDQLKRWTQRQERLVVRWKLTTVFRNAEKRMDFQKHQNYTRFQSRRLESLTDSECTPGFCGSMEQLRSAWRGPTARGGSTSVQRPESEAEFQCPIAVCGKRFFDAERLWTHHEAVHRRPDTSSQKAHEICVEDTRRRLESVVSIDDDDDPSATVRKYTFGDGFCCGGGVSSAAQMAGLEVLWGFDNDPNTKPTYVKNFPNAKHYLTDVHEFATNRLAERVRSKQHFVDILHFSPVCDYYSPNKTVRGCVDDDAKESTLFCGPEMLELCRPRIVTIEQTFGLIERWQPHFKALISSLTLKGYSVSWQVVKFQNLGAPQRRRRLIIIASCPGETLPPVPPDTHSEYASDGLKRLTSVNSVLARIPRRAPNHDIIAAIDHRQLPWDGSGIINCIVRSITIAHPSGGRKLTLRELAALQTFPMFHEFVGTATEIKKMIGNAVPPGIMKLIFVGIRKHLEKSDGVVLEAVQLD